MNSTKNEFRDYAVHHHNIGSQYVDGFIARMENRFVPMAMTPYITEVKRSANGCVFAPDDGPHHFPGRCR
jgi:hypothetical protein